MIQKILAYEITALLPGVYRLLLFADHDCKELVERIDFKARNQNTETRRKRLREVLRSNGCQVPKQFPWGAIDLRAGSHIRVRGSQFNILFWRYSWLGFEIAGGSPRMQEMPEL